MTAEPKSYLGEMMVHKLSRKAGPIVRACPSPRGPVAELTLKTYDGGRIKGSPADFQPASKTEYLSFVEGFLSDVPVTMY
jgi:hypothetical protein